MFDKIMKNQQKQADKAQAELNGFAEGVINAAKDAVTFQDAAGVIERMSDRVVAALRGYDVYLGEVQTILTRAVEIAKRGQTKEERLGAELFDIVATYSLGKLYGQAEVQRLSSIDREPKA